MTNHTAPESTTSAHIQSDTNTESDAQELALNAMGNATPPVLPKGKVVPVTYEGVQVGEATVLEDGHVSVRLNRHETFGSFRSRGGMSIMSYSFDED